MLTWLPAAAQLEEAKFFYANYHQGQARGGGGVPHPPAGAMELPSLRLSQRRAHASPPVGHASHARRASPVVRSLNLEGVADAPLPSAPPGTQQHTGPGGARSTGHALAASASLREMCKGADGLEGAVLPIVACPGDDADPCEAGIAAERLHSAADGRGWVAGTQRRAAPGAESPFLSMGSSGRAAADVAAADAAADTSGRAQAQTAQIANAAGAVTAGSGPGPVETLEGLRRAASLPLLAPALAAVGARFEARRAGYLAERACWDAVAGDGTAEAPAGGEGGIGQHACDNGRASRWDGGASDSGGKAAAGAGACAPRPPCGGGDTAGSAAEAGGPLGVQAAGAGSGARPVSLKLGAPSAADAPARVPGAAAGPRLGPGTGFEAKHPRPTPMDSVARQGAGGRRGGQRSRGPGKAGGPLEVEGVRPAHSSRAGAGEGARYAEGHAPASNPSTDAAVWATPPASPPAPLEGAGAAAQLSPLGRAACREAGAGPATPRRDAATGAGLAVGSLAGRHPAARARRRAQRRLHATHERGAWVPADTAELGACASPAAEPYALPARAARAPGRLRDCASAVWLSAASPAPAAAAGRRAEWPDPLAWTAEAARYRFRTLALSFNDARVPGALRPLVQVRAWAS